MTHFVIYAERYVREDLPIGRWLASADVEALGGFGEAHFTPDVHEALTFATREEAVAFLHAVPTTRPLREDGEVNRPLRAFDARVVRWPESMFVPDADPDANHRLWLEAARTRLVR